VLAALAEFEAEGGKSLDRAFGLKRRGRPLSGAEAGGYALAHEVYWRPPGVTFGEIARRHDMDTENGRRYLRRQLKRYEGRILENAKARLLEGKRGAT
jgi:hypothetical protein